MIISESWGIWMYKNGSYPLYEIPQIISLWDMLQQRAVKMPDVIAFACLEKSEWQQITCLEFRDDVRRVALYLGKIGLHGAHVGILGKNTYRWLAAFMAIACSGNTAVPLDMGMPLEELSEVIQRMDVEAVITDDMDILPNMASCKAYTFDAVFKEAEKMRYSERCGEIVEPDLSDIACIFLTSGTTCGRKGVMLTHGNLVSNINESCKLFELKGNVLAVLPFHHAFGLMVAVWMAFNYGYPVYISRGYRYLQKEMREVKPQTMMLVPLFIETFHKQIWNEARQGGKDKRLHRALRITEILYKLGVDVRKRWFYDVRASFGGELEYVICGGAGIDENLIKEFRLFGIEILNGYGTTECSPVVAVNRNHYHKDGSVGLAVPNSKIKISKDGEVLVSGAHVMKGYYGDEVATSEVLKDGWYHTGDLGYIDENDFLTLTGRKKNLIILSSGENISPEELEEKLMRIDGINETVVYEKDGAVAVEIFPEKVVSEEDIKSAVGELNRGLPMYKRMTKVYFRDEPFEKTTTQKIKRESVKNV